MELRHLRYFVAVAEELHFRRAAERLYVAQPAISEQIRKLEAELGVQLFVRSRRGVSLTLAGAALLDEARRVLRQADLACEVAREAHHRMVGQMRVGFLPDALPPIVPRLLGRFAQAAPGIRVTLEGGATRRLLEDVREQRLDLAIVCLPAPVSGLRVVPIADEGFVAAVPEGHCCADEREIDLAGLQHTRLVQLARATNPAFYDGVLAACSVAGISPALVEVAAPTLEQVLLTVAAGVGIALLPASTEGRIAMPGVRFKPLAAPHPSYTVALVGHREPGTSAAALLRVAARVARPALVAAA
jgi:DNA-binding transcriptional LysR family regulator